MVIEKPPEGKIKHQREYDNLKGFIYEIPKTPAEKQHNKQSLQLAEAVRAKRIVEAQNGEHGFKTDSKLIASFFDYFEKLCDEKAKARSKSNYSAP